MAGVPVLSGIKRSPSLISADRGVKVMLFNITSCLLVLFTSVCLSSLIWVYMLDDNTKDSKEIGGIFAKFVSCGATLAFMRVMSWQNWWR